MSYTSPLEEESSSLTTPILLFDEIKIRLNDSKALVELDEIKRVLGWHRIEENEQLKKEIEQLTDALSDLEKAIGERNSREIKNSSFINEKTQTQPSLQRKGQERGIRKGGGRKGGKEVIVSSESINTVVDPAFERGLLEAQIAFFVDRLRRHSSAPLVGSETSIGLATIGEKHISSKRPQTATNRSIDEQLQVSTQKQSSSSSSSSSSSLRSTFTNTNILISNEPSSDANLLPIRSAGSGSGSGVGVAISNSRPATGSSFASGGRSSSAGGSSYLSTGREALDSVGLLSPSSPSLLLNNPSSSGNIGGSRKLWDTDDIESRTAITALKAALQEETETLEQDVEWLHAQMEALMSSIDDEPTNLSSSSSSSTSIDQRHHREILEEAEAALISDGKEDLTALRVLKKDLQRTYLQSEECREITKTTLSLSNKASSSSSSSTQNRELEGQGVILTGLSNLSITGTNGSMSSKTTTISSTSLSSSSSSSSVLSTDDQAAAARMRARRGLPTRLGTGSTTNMITTEGVKTISSDTTSLALDDERFFS
jgi:hypothetical protein